MASRPPFPPRKFAESGFVELNAAEEVEEENVPAYKSERLLPPLMGTYSDQDTKLSPSLALESNQQFGCVAVFGKYNTTIWSKLSSSS